MRTSTQPTVVLYAAVALIVVGVVLFAFVVYLLPAGNDDGGGGSASDSRLLGKWEAENLYGSGCGFMRGFYRIAFLKDGTIIFYDHTGSKERQASIDAGFDLLGSSQIKITSYSGLLAGADVLDYNISGQGTLELCNTNGCCDLTRP